jgi:hypothetical protein
MQNTLDGPPASSYGNRDRSDQQRLRREPGR